MKRFLILLLLAALLFPSVAPRVQALSCAPPGPVQEELERSSVVFKGKVKAIERDGLAVFQIEQAWKGVTGPEFEIYQSGWDPFTKGEVYLVFGTEQQDGTLRTNLCGLTGLWSDSSAEVMQELGIEPQVFHAQESVDGIERSSFVNNILALCFLLLILSLIIVRNRVRR